MTTDEATVAEEQKLSLHIYLTQEGYEKIKKCAEYAVLEGLIEGHPRGNFSAYAQFCLQLGEAYIKQDILKKQGYR